MENGKLIEPWDEGGRTQVKVLRRAGLENLDRSEGGLK